LILMIDPDIAVNNTNNKISNLVDLVKRVNQFDLTNPKVPPI